MKVCVVTCTGGRPELFALCRRWVERQTHPIDSWVVVTDNGDVPDLPKEATFSAVPPVSETMASLPCGRPAWALQHALSLVPAGHHVVVMEDDDWYRSDHVGVALRLLRDHAIVQLKHLHRFYLPSHRFQRGFPGAPDQSRLVPGIASFRHEAIASVSEALGHEPFGMLDIHHYCEPTVVSIKGVGWGLPGRSGATTKHRPDHPKVMAAVDDVGDRLFRKFLGDDADHYLRLLTNADRSLA